MTKRLYEKKIPNLHLESTQELKRLRLKIRNKVRAIAFKQDVDAVSLLNKLRREISIVEFFQVERAIKLLNNSESLFPECFPKNPQTKENYYRLCEINFFEQMRALDLLISENWVELLGFVNHLKDLNDAIVSKNYVHADLMVKDIVSNFGYSHFILRKAALIRSLKCEDVQTPAIDGLFESSGVATNNIIISSLLHCFQEEQNFISMKRSVMGIHNRGNSNKFTRDIARIPFHPHAKSIEELSELIQSSLQSSLIDGLIMAKINSELIPCDRYVFFWKMLESISNASPTLAEISILYSDKDDPEDWLYKQSSAWYENDFIIKKRFFLDHFYDSPDMAYISLDQSIVNKVENLIPEIKLNELDTKQVLVNHACSELHRIESQGTITRSAIFNYLVHLSGGNELISEDQLFSLMGITSDLSRTIDIGKIKNLASCQSSKYSKLILYLLVARRSKNEMDSYQLRRLLQEIVISNFGSSLTNFVESIAGRSLIVAKFIYEICTEDFIAHLSHLIKRSSQITEVRADLHRWMGTVTSEKSYFDRARNLVIDHQINVIRDEIDDNRIYVDINRFSEWMDDEIMQELRSLLTMLEHNTPSTQSENPQVKALIEKCYNEFCSNKYFGIASYLGRRIRHGTFKGHLFSSIVSIADRYKTLLNNPTVFSKWEAWKAEYEKRIDWIIREKLHIETSKKREGFLQPNLKAVGKNEIASACTVNLLQDFQSNRHTYGSTQLLIEYCWRLAEVDLKSINAFLKNQKRLLVNADAILEIKTNVSQVSQDVAKDFCRDLQSSIGEKLNAIHGWFKRPLSASPKASLGLLYKAVVAEVRQFYPSFDPVTDFEPEDDLELMGGAYHVIYDALYVIVFNAAKHGKPKGKVLRNFSVPTNDNKLVIEIQSEIDENDNEDMINSKLIVSPDDDIENAQLYESRSGIKKLYHFDLVDKNFALEEIHCRNKMVVIRFSYGMAH